MRGKTDPIRTEGAERSGASMRPRIYAGKDFLGYAADSINVTASMRPRIYAGKDTRRSFRIQYRPAALQ